MARTTFSFHWCSQQGWAFLTAWKHIPVFFSIKLVYKSMTLSENQTYLKYTKLYKKDLHDPDNHDGVIAHLEPDILECEVKWALESRWNSSWAVSNRERWCCESAALNMPTNLENSAVATGLEKVSFHSNPKERQCQRMLNLPHNCTHLTC